MSRYAEALLVGIGLTVIGALAGASMNADAVPSQGKLLVTIWGLGTGSFLVIASIVGLAIHSRGQPLDQVRKTLRRQRRPRDPQ